MSKQKVLLDCTFSWGKICRVYENSIEVAGKSYNLENLTSIHPTYRKMFGVSSARLDLSFGPRRLTLRGIADPEVARQIVSHLLTYCPEWSTAKGPHARPIRGRDLVRAQARAWERTNKLPAMPKSSQDSIFEAETEVRLATPEATLATPEQALSESSLFEESEAIFTEVSQDKSEETFAEVSQRKDVEMQEISEKATTALVVCELSSSPIVTERVQKPLQIPRLQPPLRSVQLVNVERKRLDSCPMPAVSVVKSGILPVIHVPVRLQPGECAHYSIGVTLCSEKISEPDDPLYQPLDNGLLILTNRRLFYVGRHSQLILPYTQLWYVSLLHDAIALHMERQFRRIIIEVEHSSEWASRIEQLAYIARNSSVHAARLPIATSALITLDSPSGLTGIVTRHGGPVGFPGKSGAGWREARIVEARTISLDVENVATHEFLPEATQIVAMPGPGEKAAPAARLLAIEAQVTQEFTGVRAASIEAQTTQEFTGAKAASIEAQATQELARAIIEQQITQEFSQLKPAAIEAQATQTFDVVVPRSIEEWIISTSDESQLSQEEIDRGQHLCSEMETRPLYKQPGKEEEDESTICLRDRRKMPASTIPRRVQTRRKLTTLNELEDTPAHSRRALRGRTKRSPQS